MQLKVSYKAQAFGSACLLQAVSPMCLSYDLSICRQESREEWLSLGPVKNEPTFLSPISH